MDKDTATKFRDSFGWWNDFLRDLKTLFDKISPIVEKDLGYIEKSYYYYKSNDAPSIPSAYYLCLSGENKPHIQLSIILDNEYLDSNVIQSPIPIILVTLHNFGSNTTEVSYDILDNKNVKQITEADGIISGVLDWEPAVQFSAFRVPLDVFEKYDDEIVRERIVAPIKELSKKK